jgi:hypothetical protein
LLAGFIFWFHHLAWYFTPRCCTWLPPTYTLVLFHAGPVQPPPLELEDELDDELELLLELDELEELLEELELDELLDELELDELELDEEELLLDEDELLELDELLEPVVSHTPRSFQALVQAQPTPGS